MASVIAPQAPGDLATPVEPQQFLRYLGALGEWISARRSELDALDRAAQAQHLDVVTPDLVLSMALWQACQERYELLLATWDNGRVGDAERVKLATLIWGRMDPVAGAAATPGSTAMSLPEACRLSDALVGQLRTRLQLDPDADRLQGRLSAVRATIERLRDQVLLEPATERAAAAAKVAGFAARAEQVATKASRGGDVGGLLGPLELDTATLERDLIVGGARRRQSSAARDDAEQRRADLLLRADAVRALVAQTVAAVSPAPRFAVPDVQALGEVPSTDAELAAYQARLDQVSRALQVVQASYSNALAERGRLAAQAEVLFARLDAATHVDPDLTELGALTARLLGRTPTPVPVVAGLVQALQAAVGAPDTP